MGYGSPLEEQVMLALFPSDSATLLVLILVVTGATVDRKGIALSGAHRQDFSKGVQFAEILLNTPTF